MLVSCQLSIEEVPSAQPGPSSKNPQDINHKQQPSPHWSQKGQLARRRCYASDEQEEGEAIKPSPT
jgi:hypothetical protein